VILLFWILASTQAECMRVYEHRVPRSGSAYFHAFDPAFVAVGSSRNLEPELLKAIAWCETRLDPCATSPVGARGIMQFMPTTFSAVASAAGASDPYNPADSIESAGVYVAALVNYWFARGAGLDAVVASYNAGPTAVLRARNRGLQIPNIEETQRYVTCVLDARARFRLTTGALPTRVAAPSFSTVFNALFRMDGWRQLPGVFR